VNAKELSQALAANAARVAEHLLPKGRKVGGEWKAGSVSGEEGKSLSVCVRGAKAGVWSDFSTGDGGDLLDLWAACRGQSIGEAIVDAKAFLGIRDAMPPREVKQYRRPAKPQCRAPQTRVRAWLMGRGLTEQTIEAFRISEHERDGKSYAVFPYLRDGELINAKHRNVDEKRDMRQEAGAEPCLFGWHLVEPKARSITITEGEIDAMTLHQVGIPALSVNAGAGNHQWIENDWDRLERFSEIFVAFDDDEAGRKGAKEVAQRLGLDRCRFVTFGAKDANQWLTDGADGEEFHHALSIAKAYDPEELASIADSFDAVKALFYPAQDYDRHPTLRVGGRDCEWFEFRPGEYSVWTGINGHGKSLMLGQVLLEQMAQGHRALVFSGELPAARLAKRLVKQATGLDRPTPAYIDAVCEWVRDRMWIVDIVGTAKLDRLLEVFSYAARRYGIKHCVIDSLMLTDVPEDGPGALSAQKAAVQKIVGFARSSGCHLHLVAHPRKARDESLPPGKLDVGGSSRITDAADNIFAVWSACKESSAAPDDKPDALLELLKQRHGDEQHRKLWLFFNRSAQQYTLNSSRRPISLVPFEGEPYVHRETA
jgi:twinkle protein